MDEKLTQVLHKVELLCEQNPEFRKELCRRMGMRNAPCSESPDVQSETTAFIQLQRKKMRQKGRLYYQNIIDPKLRNQLVNDYAMMLWYKCIGDIPRMFAHILFQMENMLNAFVLSHGAAAYEEVKNNAEKYIYSTQKDFKVEAKGQFFDANGKKKTIESIGIWAKYAYWFVSTGQVPKFQSKTHYVVSNAISIRNYTEHRSAQKEMPKWMNDTITSWGTNVDTKFSYIDLVLSTIRQSIDQKIINDYEF